MKMMTIAFSPIFRHASVSSTYPCQSFCIKVGDTFEFPFSQRFWTVTECPQRLVTFETFDQSDEAKCARSVWRSECFSGWVVWRQQCSKLLMAAVLCKQIYSSFSQRGMHKGIKASGDACRPECFSKMCMK